MPRTIEVQLFKFEELSDDAKERAREWWRQGGLDYEWWDAVYDDFQQIAEMLGITFRTDAVKLMGGGTRPKPRIYHSGFWSQGDGASFEGSWEYAKGSAKAIRAHAPKDEELHRIADTLQDVSRRNFYRLYAAIERGHYGGNYVHENTVVVKVSDREGERDPRDEDCETIRDAMRDLMRWLYRSLEAEYEYLMSDEAVDESIIANEYEFEEDGSRA